MKQRVAEMEREANKLRELQAAAEQANHSGDDSGTAMDTEEDKALSDSRSVYVGNVSAPFARVQPKYLTGSHLGGLLGHPRGDTRAFPSMWNNQSSNNFVRQVHRPSERVGVCAQIDVPNAISDYALF